MTASMSSLGPKAILLGAILIIVSAGATGHARDRELLNQAVANSAQERASIEREYKDNDKTARSQVDPTEIRTIKIELGDELNTQGDHLRFRSRDRGLREKAVSVKLDREWKEVNRQLKAIETSPQSGSYHEVQRQ